MTQLPYGFKYKRVPTRDEPSNEEEEPSNERVRDSEDGVSGTTTTSSLNEGGPVFEFMDFLTTSTQKTRPWPEFMEKWPKMPKSWSYKELIDGRLRTNLKWFKGNYVLIVVIAISCFIFFSSPFFVSILGCIAVVTPTRCMDWWSWVSREYPNYRVPLQLIAGVCLLGSLSGVLIGVYYGLVTSTMLCCMHAILKPRCFLAKANEMTSDRFGKFVRNPLHFCGGIGDETRQRANIRKTHTS